MIRQTVSKLRASGELPAPSATSNSGEKVRELSISNQEESYRKWEDNASCIMMSENPTNRDRSRHVDVQVHYLCDLDRVDHVKLVKCAGTRNVSDTLTKSLTRPTFEKHRKYLRGTLAFFSSLQYSRH